MSKARQLVTSMTENHEDSVYDIMEVRDKLLAYSQEALELVKRLDHFEGQRSEQGWFALIQKAVSGGTGMSATSLTDTIRALGGDDGGEERNPDGTTSPLPHTGPDAVPPSSRKLDRWVPGSSS